MHIQLIEIGNFRKLKAVRVDFAEDKTVFVGANNSGKTSAMVALRRFLVDSSAFNVNDFTLSHWKAMNDEATEWEGSVAEDEEPAPLTWQHCLPFMDVWLNVPLTELHYVRTLLPSLDWEGGILGVRLRFQPKDAKALQQEYLRARAQITATLSAANAAAKAAKATAAGAEPSETPDYSVALWPRSMVDFLDRRMTALFEVRGYLLDPSKLVAPAHGQANPQDLSAEDEPIEGNPFNGLIKVNEIGAQRGFGQVGTLRQGKGQAEAERSEAKGGSRLAKQLRSYYTNHLDPYDMPEPTDIDALAALETASGAFDIRLKDCFANALQELDSLGYPGVTDPRLTISTRIKATDGLSHDAAVQYEVPTHGAGAIAHRLPEDSNGLGYQNLISMVFDLMSFRDSWMRVGKAGKSAKAEDAFKPPLHLVLVEEPEAHLHAQVQQVFIKHAYGVLRNHTDLGTKIQHRTQLVVSTHSSHVAHACEFASLRYFRRLPPAAVHSAVPLASVVNLSEVFGGAGQTEQFVTRYLKATHCDLFFADGVVMVEGPAERILVPNFVEERPEFEFLKRCYLTWLEIGGSHAHRLKSLVEHLGITTLIITDLDARAATTEEAVVPKRKQGHRARNHTLKTWVPGQEDLDTLLDTTSDGKEKRYPTDFGVRAAYQTPVNITFKTTECEALANTFEDALLYENIDFFTGRAGTGLMRKFHDALANSADFDALALDVHTALKGGGKAEFAMDILYSPDLAKVKVPAYLRDGLAWLIQQLQRKEREAMGTAAVAP